MKSKFEEFKALHQVKELFVLPNAWDAKSAQLLEESGYKAIGTSSAAVAGSLGYADGEAMPFDEYLLIIRRIVASVDLPVTIDLEMGYGKSKEAIYRNVQRLLEVGVIGINLEDSVITKAKRTLGNADDFARTLTYLKEKLLAHNQSLFINVRSDTYLLKINNAGNESTRRAALYQTAGADGLFLPFLSDDEEIALAASSTKLPLNVMCVPGLADLNKLETLGVKRASMGPFLHIKTYKQAKEMATGVVANKNFSSIL